MKEPIFPNDGGKDAWMVVPVMTEQQWNAYHAALSFSRPAG